MVYVQRWSPCPRLGWIFSCSKFSGKNVIVGCLPLYSWYEWSSLSLSKTISNNSVKWTVWAWREGCGICWIHRLPKKTITVPMPLLDCCLKGGVHMSINSWIPWYSDLTRIWGTELTYCRIISCLQPTRLLPKICTMWSERWEDSFCNMFSLFAVCQGYYRQRKWKTSICDHMANAWPSLWLPRNILFLISKLSDFGYFILLTTRATVSNFTNSCVVLALKMRHCVA